MKTDTRQRILNYIKERRRVTPREVITHFNLNASGVFRHLEKLLQNNQIIKEGKPPKVLYSPKILKQKTHSDIIQSGFTWNEKNIPIPSDVYCPTRDVFQARLDRLLAALLKQFDENSSYLLVAVVGEIGNNSFDHNLGNWPDIAGIYFAINLENHEILIADRGCGVFKTIKKVRPAIKTDEEAIRIAFTERISGRAPEQRGNGLKFVKKIIEERGWELNFYSGESMLQIKNGVFDFKNQKNKTAGILALLKF